MQLLAGSLNVEVEGYLHAGYISAHPRTFADGYGSHQLAQATPKVLDVKKSLELRDATDQGAPATMVEASSNTLPPASMTTDGFMLAVLFFFFAYLIGLYYRRMRKIERPGWRPWLAALSMLLLIVLVYLAVPKYQELIANNLPPPWLDVPVQEYKDPEAATQVLLHGLVVNALGGCPYDVETLAAIQGEVAFPIPAEEFTPGMAYAVKTYGRDGWGRDFSFEPLGDGRYRIASAGADGVFGTKDDIVYTTLAFDEGNWEQHVNGVYVRPVGGELACLVHRVGHDKFRTAHAAEAKAATRVDLFDLFRFQELSRHSDPQKGPHPILAKVGKYQESRPPEGESEPLYFVQIIYARDG